MKFTARIILIFHFFLLLLFAGSQGTTYSFSSDGTWIRQNSNTTKNINRICFTDSLTGWAAGDSGLIIHTTNGGLNWASQITNTIFYITDLRFLNSQTGWAVCFNNYGFANSTILKTTNGGLNWINYPLQDTTILLFTIYFLDGSTGWAGAYLGKVLRTSDGGMNWSLIPHDTSQFTYSSIQRIEFYNSRIAVGSGGTLDFAGVSWKLNETQSVWNSQAVSAEPLYAIAFLDSSRVFCVGGDPEYGVIVVKSTDSGTNWIYDPPNFAGIAKSISLRTQTEIWMGLSYLPNFLISTTGGNSWYEMVTPDTTELNEVYFFDAAHGWAAGVGGRIFRYNSAVIGVEPVSVPEPAKYELSEFYPNPFNPASKVNLQLHQNTFVKLELFDAPGRSVMVIQDGALARGSYSFRVDGRNLSSGLYFCRVSVGDEITVRKLILLK